MMLGNRRRDLIAGVLFCALGLVTVFVLIPLGVKVPDSIEIKALSPSFWPTIIAVCSTIAAIALVIESTLLQQPGLEDEEQLRTEYELATLPALLRTLVLMGALFGFYLSLTKFGMVVTSIILIAAMMLFFGERKLALIASLSIGVPILLYLFFRYVANVPIPLGMFGA